MTIKTIALRLTNPEDIENAMEMLMSADGVAVIEVSEGRDPTPEELEAPDLLG